MTAELHHFQLILLCQISKLAPNILWSVGSSLHNQFLQVGRGNPAVMVARLSLNSVLDRHEIEMKTPGVADLTDTPTEGEVLRDQGYETKGARAFRASMRG
jgi:hypothetical protein